MKTSIFKKLVVGVSTCAVAFGVIVGCNTVKSYASDDINNNEKAQAITLAEKEAFGMSEEDYNAECDMHRHVADEKAETPAKKDSDVYYVKDGQFNTITKKLLDNKDFSFTYNLRGWFGNSTSDFNRHAHVQFFYNTENNKLVLLTFGKARSDGFRTWSLSRVVPPSWFNTVLEDTHEFGIKDDKTAKINISQWAKELYVDPAITSFGRAGLQCLLRCSVVDTCNKAYEVCSYKSSTNNFSESCFKKIGTKLAGGHQVVDMAFLKGASDSIAQELGSKIGFWADDAKLLIKDKVYID